MLIIIIRFGCNVPYPRVFDEVQALYSSQMIDVLSGGLVYEYSQETTNYGLVQTYSNGTAQLLSDYESLMGQYNQIDVTLIEASNSTATHTPPACNANLITEDGFSTDFNIPDPPSGAQALISAGVSSAPTGSIVSITQTSVQLAVYATDGGQLAGLAITTQQGANAPGSTHSVSTRPVSSTSTSRAASSTGQSSGSTATSGTTATSAGSGSATGAAASASSSAATLKLDASLVGNAMAAAVVGVLALAL